MHLKGVQDVAMKELVANHPAANASTAAKEGRMLTGSSSADGSSADGRVVASAGNNRPSSTGGGRNNCSDDGVGGSADRTAGQASSKRVAPAAVVNRGDQLFVMAQQIQLGLQQLGGNAGGGDGGQSETVASMKMALDVFLKQTELDMHADKKKHDYELARQKQAAITARHLKEDANRTAEFKDKMDAKRATLEHSMKAAATRATAERSKGFEVARASSHASTRVRMKMQLMVCLALVMFVAVAHVWSDLTAEGDICPPPDELDAPENSKGIWYVHAQCNQSDAAGVWWCCSL